MDGETGCVMTKLGLIVNPGSHGNKANGSVLTEFLADRPEILHRVLDDVDQIPAVLKQFSQAGVEVLAVAGGDGTVQLVLTELFSRRPFAELPLIAILPRGRTNMTAADIGVRGRGVRGLKRLIDAADRSDLDRFAVERRVLRIEHAKGVGPQYGMFFGGAAIWRAIEFTRREVHQYGVGADATSAIAMLRLLGRWLFAGGGEGKIFRGDQISIALDDEDLGPRSSLVVMATTLDKLLIGSRPYWNIGTGRVAFTHIAYPPRHLAWHVLRLLYGGPRRKLPANRYFSRGADRVRLTMECPFTVDGAYFEPDEGKEVILTGDQKVSFVRL